MNIVIIGMRGTGKTTVGSLLSKSLKRQFVETDVLVVKKANQPISGIVSERGWDFFRDLESNVIEEVTKQDNCVIATGGGAVVRPHNVNLLKKNSIVILLTAHVDTMTARLKSDSKRPSLTAKHSLQDEIIEVLKDRKHLYENAADITVCTDNLDPAGIVQTIINTLHI